MRSVLIGAILILSNINATIFSEPWCEKKVPNGYFYCGHVDHYTGVVTVIAKSFDKKSSWAGVFDQGRLMEETRTNWRALVREITTYGADGRVEKNSVHTINNERY